MAKHSKHAVNALKESQKVFPRALSTFQRRFCGTKCKNIQKEKRELGQLMLRYKFDGGTVQNTDRIKKTTSPIPKTTLEHLQTFLALCSSESRESCKNLLTNITRTTTLKQKKFLQRFL